MNSTQFWVAALVPTIVQKASPVVKKILKLQEFDVKTQRRASQQEYPAYFGFLYSLWVITLLASGIGASFLLVIFLSQLLHGKGVATLIFVGLINSIGAWFIGGAVLDGIFWWISSSHFRDYVMLRQLQSGWGYDIKQQISVMLKIGVVYYLVALPLMIFLLWVG